MPLWHVDYSELKAIKNQQIQENLYLSLNYLKEFRMGVWPREQAITRDNF